MKQLIVNKEELRHNINKIKTYVKEISRDNDYTIIAVVKGNGYGLGLKEYPRNINRKWYKLPSSCDIRRSTCFTKRTSKCKHINAISFIQQTRIRRGFKKQNYNHSRFKRKHRNGK